MLNAIAFVVAVVTTGPADNAQRLDLQAELRSLVEVERAFAKAVAARGVREGFLAYLAEDGVLFRPGPVNGRQWTAERPASDAYLGWEPIFADVSRTGDLGYTTGPWELRPQGRRGKATLFGHYVTVWRKQADGAWKAALDVGITHPRPSSKPPPYRPDAAGPTVLRPAGDPDSVRVEVLRADSAFSAASAERGISQAYESFALRDLRLYREGRPPLVGLQAARAFVLAQTGALTWEPQHAEAARASDLAYSYGGYRYASRAAPAGAGAERGWYARIWKRKTNGDWGVVLDLMSPAPEPEVRR